MVGWECGTMVLVGGGIRSRSFGLLRMRVRAPFVAMTLVLALVVCIGDRMRTVAGQTSYCALRDSGEYCFGDTRVFDRIDISVEAPPMMLAPVLTNLAGSELSDMVRLLLLLFLLCLSLHGSVSGGTHRLCTASPPPMFDDEQVLGTNTSLHLFENVGDSEDPDMSLTNNSNVFAGVNELLQNRSRYPFSSAFADLNGDGSQDLALTVNDSFVAIFPNEGTARKPAYSQPSLWLDMSRDNCSEPFVALVDLDGDNATDLVAGCAGRAPATGTLSYWPNGGTQDTPLFDGPASSDDNKLVSFTFDTFAAPTFADLDNDGDYDCVVGDYAGIYYIVNVGGPFFPNFLMSTTAYNPFTDLLSADTTRLVITLGHLSGDSFVDAVVSDDGDDMEYFENKDAAQIPSFVEISEAANPLQGQATDYYYSDPYLVDLTGDGKVDVVAGDQKGGLILFENVGDAEFPSWTRASNNPFAALVEANNESTVVWQPAFADFDNDSAPDLILGTDTSLLWIPNLGTKTTPLFSVNTTVLLNGTSTSFYDPAIGDLDHDGRALDLAVANSSGHVEFLLFNGTNCSGQLQDGSPCFTVAGTMLVGVATERELLDLDLDGVLDDVTGVADPSLADLNGDGLTDLVITHFDTGDIDYYERVAESNSSALNFTKVSACDANPFSDFTTVEAASLAIADVDGDADHDVVMGTTSGTFFTYLNGRCVQEHPCSNDGQCETATTLKATCKCLLGHTGDRCDECETGFYGDECDECPGITQDGVTDLGNACNQQGTCFDSKGGNGTCSCTNDDFNITDCSGSCEPGTYRLPKSNSSIFTCEVCPLYSFSSEADQSSCTPCDSGLTNDKTGSTSCDQCLAGQYMDKDETCQSCRHGFACDTSSRTGWNISTVEIKPGWWRKHTTSETTYRCPLTGACRDGHSSSSSSSSSSDTNGTQGSGTELCSEGFKGPACAVCEDDWFLDPVQETCRECQPTAFSNFIIVLQLVLAGAIIIAFVAILAGGCWSGDDSDGSDRIRKLFQSAAGDGLVSDVQEQVAEQIDRTMEGVQMTEPRSADAGASLSDDEEAATKGTSASASAGAGGEDEEVENRNGGSHAATAAPAPAGNQAEESPTNDEQQADDGRVTSRVWRFLRTKGKIIITLGQILSSLPATLPIKFPGLFLSQLKLFNIVNLNFALILGPAKCAAQWNFYGSLVFATLGPIVLGTLVWLATQVHVWRVRQRHRAAAAKDNEKEAEANDQEGVADRKKELEAVEERVRLIKAQCTEVLLLISFLVLPSVSTRILRVFICDTVDGTEYLAADYSIECYDSWHRQMMVYAGGMILVYPLGIPGMYLWLLWCQRKHINPSESFVAKYKRRRVKDMQILLEHAMQIKSTEDFLAYVGDHHLSDAENVLLLRYYYACGREGGEDKPLPKEGDDTRSEHSFQVVAGDDVLDRFVSFAKRPNGELMDDKHAAREIVRQRSHQKLAAVASNIFNTDKTASVSLNDAMEQAKIEARERRKEIEPYSFLFTSYLPRAWFWEPVECIRRLMTTAVLILFSDSPTEQIVFGIIVTLAFMKLYSHYAPFVGSGDNLLAELAQWETFLVLFVALLLLVDEAPRSMAISVLLVVLTMVAPVLAVYQTVAEATQGEASTVEPEQLELQTRQFVSTGHGEAPPEEDDDGSIALVGLLPPSVQTRVRSVGEETPPRAEPAPIEMPNPICSMPPKRRSRLGSFFHGMRASQFGEGESSDEDEKDDAASSDFSSSDEGEEEGDGDGSDDEPERQARDHADPHDIDYATWQPTEEKAWYEFWRS